jgi:uncharacterized membrane protein
MDEKKVTMDDAFKIWWFMAWRITLTAIGVVIIFSFMLSFIKITETIKPLVSTLSCIASLLISVYYIKIAINRNYSSFRLSATLLKNNKQNGEQSNEQ